MLALLVGNLARLQCQLGVAHTLQHVVQTPRAGNGWRLELVAGRDQLSLDFLSNKKRFYATLFFSNPSCPILLSMESLGA